MADGERAGVGLPPGRIPTLDGVRAVAIGLVLCGHAIGTGVIPMNTRFAHLFGGVGVRAFFVLSGFLITTLLVRERRRSGRISLGGFYMRRVLRIFPAFYTYVGVTCLLAAAGVVTLRDGDLIAAATYTTNFHAERAWATGHLWSLAVEEQFYLVWPLLVVGLGLTRSWSFAVAAIVLAPVMRLALWYLAPEHRGLVDQAFPCVFDALATGCVVALAADRLLASPRLHALVDSKWFWALPALGLAPLFISTPWLRFGVGMTTANFAIACVILRCVMRPSDAVGRFLERPTMIWIGTLSYSLYLWQQLFVNRHGGHWVHEFPFNIVVAFAAAVVCHYLIERRFLSLGSRWRDRPVVLPMAQLPSLLSSDPVIDVAPRTQRRPSTATLSLASLSPAVDNDRPE